MSSKAIVNKATQTQFETQDLETMPQNCRFPPIEAVCRKLFCKDLMSKVTEKARNPISERLFYDQPDFEFQ